jgi:hypothetical protein
VASAVVGRVLMSDMDTDSVLIERSPRGRPDAFVEVATRHDPAKGQAPDTTASSKKQEQAKQSAPAITIHVVTLKAAKG